MCKEVDGANEKVKGIIAMMGLPDHCPVAESKICSDESKAVKLGKFKSMLAAAKGKTHVQMFIEHNTVSYLII